MKLGIIIGILLALAVVFLILAIKLKGKFVKIIFGTGVCLSIISVCILLITPLLDKTNYGLDLQGGFEVLYQVEPLDGKKLDSDMVYNTYKAMLKRIDILGVSEPEISIEGENRIRVRLAGITDGDKARETISSTASLTFRDYNDNLLMTSDILSGSAKVTKDENNKPAIGLSIKDTDKFGAVTGRVKDMTNNVIVIWLDYDENEDSYVNEQDKCGSLSDSRCLSAASVNEAFYTNQVIIQGNFTNEEANSLVELINSGALPTKLTEISSRTVEAEFGANSLNRTLIASAIGLILIAVVMIGIYKFSGFVSCLGILVYTILSLVLFYLIGGVLTLPGIAAMLLGIGMAVDASVISAERIKDQLKIGKNLKTAFDLGNKNSLSSIMDGNITTIIIAIVLFIFGESAVKGFATMLIISVLVTLLVMVLLTKVILRLFVKTGFFDDKPNLFIGLSKKKIKPAKEVRIPFTKLDIMKNVKPFVILPIVLLSLGLIITCATKFNLGVDFTGGTSITVSKNDKTSLKKIKNDISNYDLTIKKESSSKSEITISVSETLEKDEISKLTKEIEEKYGTEADIYVVSKVVKQELTKNAIYALIIASICICIYVSIRFKFNYAFAALIALFHDALFVLLFFGVFKIEITTTFIAAILTIIGYSINDTIVTFDMVRESYKHKHKGNVKDEKELRDLVNDSIKLTLFRSIVTSLTTIIPVICLMLFGAKEIFGFNLALLIGFVVGVYSSIFISNQIWFVLEKRRVFKKKKPKKKYDDNEPDELRVKGVNC